MSDDQTYVCRDCKFYRGGLCFHRNAYSFSKETGAGKQEYANVMRIDVEKLHGIEYCMPQAKFFEPAIPPKWKFWRFI